jgi:hypothetical protein
MVYGGYMGENELRNFSNKYKQVELKLAGGDGLA